MRRGWATDREACLPYANGACWPFITQRIGQIVYGFYDAAERWRVDIAFVLLAGALVVADVAGAARASGRSARRC